MFKKGLFREQALSRKAEPEQRDDLLRVTAPREWLLLCALGATAIAALVWCVLAEVERTLADEGAFLRPGERHAVVAPLSGVVAEVMARPGEEVEAGQTLARLRLPDLDWRLRLARARVGLLEEPAPVRGAPEESALASARAEMVELAAMASAGTAITSPHVGELAASGLVVGQAVSAGEPVAEIRVGAGRPQQAVMRVTPEQAERIAIGMKARVTPIGRSGAGVFPAEVVAVSPMQARPPAWLARFGLASEGELGAPSRIVRVAIDADGEFLAQDGAACRIEIVLMRSSPFGLMLANDAAQ